LFADEPQPVAKKRQVIMLWGCLGVAIRLGCKVMKLTKGSFYHKPKGKAETMPKKADIEGKIEAICLEFPRYG
jgi:hypothetical protein